MLLHVAGLDAQHWPAAMRHCTVLKLGVNTHPMLPFGKTACVKAKSWDHRYEDWRPSFVTGIIYGPSPTMNHGWVLRTVEGRCVHARTALVPDKNMDKVRLELEEGQTEPSWNLKIQQVTLLDVVFMEKPVLKVNFVYLHHHLYLKIMNKMTTHPRSPLQENVQILSKVLKPSRGGSLLLFRDCNMKKVKKCSPGGAGEVEGTVFERLLLSRS